MSLTTLEVELDHGKVTPRGNEALPERARALLTILPSGNKPCGDPLVQHSALGKAVFHENPANPLLPEDWPAAFK